MLLPITQQLLYKEFWCDGCMETWRIKAFIRTIMTQPVLASYTVSVSLPVWRAWDRDSDPWDKGSEEYDDYRRYSLAQNRDDKKLFQRAIRDLALSDKKLWRHAVRKDVDEVYVAILILLLPNLKELNIMTPLKHAVLEKALDHATLLRPTHAKIFSLQKLEDVVYYHRGNTSKSDVHNLVPFFRLPSIKRITAGDLFISSKPWPHWPISTTLEFLKLQCHYVEPEVLGDVLRGLENLKALKYTPNSPFPFEDHDFQPQRFGLALSNVAATLREIHIDTSHSHGDGTLLGSFHSYKNLQHLSADAEWLLGDALSTRLVDILPPSLQTLNLGSSTIRCDQILFQLKELVDYTPDAFPCLRSIEVRISQSMCRTPAYQKFLLACRRANISLEHW
ncbi:MAG: hypothetical protein L6R41_000196 [Letrouitia leprolyta]|nr:MAG: hypothetical protein L6R41_000196 [Letrouitia leprolyta]